MSGISPPAPARKLTPAKGFASVFLAVFLLVFLAGAAITFTLPETFVGVARVRAAGPEQLAAFSSPANLQAVAQRLELSRTYARRYGESEPLSQGRTTDILRRTLQVRRIPGTGLAEIRVYSLSSGEAAEIANAIAESGTANKQVFPPEGHGSPLVIIDRAVPALKPVRPNKPLNLTLAAVVGIVLGVMAGGVGARLALGSAAGREAPD